MFKFSNKKKKRKSRKSVIHITTEQSEAFDIFLSLLALVVDAAILVSIWIV